MIKKLITLSFAITVLSAGLSQFIQSDAGAVSGFNAGRIIDDAIFTNKDSMSVAQIQNFLNSKVPTCDTNGVKPSEYGGGTRAQWANGRYGQTTFTCLKDYRENGNSAAQMIYNVAQQFSINPQVLIVLLQKEQGLITDEWPLNVQYRTATGYGCPDTAPCDSQYYGLGNQLTWSGRMFRAILNNSPTWYTPYVLGNNYIQYSPDASCGGSNVTIQNRSTQALYNYTPYQPNQGAIDAGYGTAPCGAYGNRNFQLYFSSWFGSLTAVGYNWALNSYGIYSDQALTKQISNDASVTLRPGQTAFMRIWARNTGVSQWRQAEVLMGTTNPYPIIKDSSWLSGNRAARMNQTVTNYDQLASFDFKITAPQQVGTYNENFNIVIDGLLWFNNVGPTIRVSVANPITQPSYTATAMLESGQTLQNNGKITSPEKHSVLKLENGQLKLYSNFKLVWTADTQGRLGTRFVNQADGNLVLYDKANVPIWSSDTPGNGASRLRIQTDGNLTLSSNSNSQVTWSTRTASHENQLNKINDLLLKSNVLFNDQQMTVSSRQHRLVLQADGNLVLYGTSGPLWASNTDRRGGSSLVLQADGNLVLYGTSGPLWASNTSGRR